MEPGGPDTGTNLDTDWNRLIPAGLVLWSLGEDTGGVRGAAGEIAAEVAKTGNVDTATVSDKATDNGTGVARAGA